MRSDFQNRLLQLLQQATTTEDKTILTLASYGYQVLNQKTTAPLAPGEASATKRPPAAPTQ